MLEAGVKEEHDEEDVSTQQSAASQSARLPPAHVHTGRPLDPQGSATPRASPPQCLIEPLRLARDFKRLASEGHRRHCGVLTVVRVDDAGLGRAKVGYAVSRRVGNAVVRNRVRRRLRSAVREIEHLPPGMYLIIPRPAAARTAYAALARNLHTCLGDRT